MRTRKYVLGGSLLVFFLLLCVIAWAFVAWFVGRGATMSEDQQYVVQGPLRHIVITNPVGDLEIRPSTDGTFAVYVHKRVRDSWFGDKAKMARVLRDMSVTVGKHDGRLDIQVHRPPAADTLRSVSVEVLITAPKQVNVDVATEVGDVRIKEVKGVIRLHVGVGSITLDNVWLLPESTIKIETGSIDFSGHLPDQGAVTLETGVGSISVELPKDSAFNLDASAGVGHVKVDLPTATYNRKGTLQLSVGHSPTTTLVVRTDTGNIKVTMR